LLVELVESNLLKLIMISLKSQTKSIRD